MVPTDPLYILSLVGNIVKMLELIAVPLANDPSVRINLELIEIILFCSKIL